MLQGHDGIDNYVAYVGTGSPRFYLPLDQQLPAASFAQVVVLAKDLESREALRKWLIERMNEDFPHLRSRISRLENGPPVGYPVQFRVSGEDIPQVRELARKVADRMRENPHVVNVHLDWEEPSKVVYLSIDQERARALGVSTASLSQFLQSALTGSHVSFFREDNELIEILLRGTEQERRDLSLLPSLAVPTENGRSVALSQIATLEYGFEEGSSGTATACRRSPCAPISTTIRCRRPWSRRSPRPWNRSAPSCRTATCWRWAERWRTRRRARVR